MTELHSDSASTLEVSPLDSDDVDLRVLQSRIEGLKGSAKGNQTFTRGVALATSMGFVLAGCLVVGFWGGHFLAEKTGYKAFEIFGLLAGLAIAIISLAKMLRPFWNNQA